MGKTERRNNALLAMGISAVVSVAFLLLYYFWGYVHYQTDDDIVMNLIAAGAFDPDMSAYLVHSNIVYGYFLRLLYHLFPNHNMYLWAMLLMNCFALAAIAAVLGLGLGGALARVGNRREEGRRRWPYVALATFAASLLLNFMLGDTYYTDLQFTENAGLYASVGCVLYFLWVYYGCRLSNPIWVPAIGYGLFGYMVRAESFKAAVAMFAIGLAAWLLARGRRVLAALKAFARSEGTEKRRAIGRKKWLAATLALFCVLLVAVSLVNNAAYAREDWRYFMEYNTYRSILLDYGMPDYVSDVDGFQAHGLSFEDIFLMVNWNYNDPDKFTLENMKWMAEKTLADSRFQLRVDRHVLVIALQSIMNRLTHAALPFCWLLLFIIAVFTGRGDMLLVFIALSGGLLAEYYYLICLGRFLWRVEVLPWIGSLATFCCLFAVEHRGFRRKRGAGTRAVAVVLVCASLLCVEIAEKHVYFVDNKKGQYAMDEDQRVRVGRKLAEAPDKFYIYTTITGIQPINRVTDIDAHYRHFYDNLCPMGGWTVPSPLHAQKMEKYGIENPMLSLIENDGNVFLVDVTGMQDNIGAYLERRTGRAIHVEQVDDVYGYPVWQFSYAEDAPDDAYANEAE